MDFMSRTFFRDEPVLVATGLAGRPSPVLLQHSRTSFKEGLSLMAVLPDQTTICGVAINSIVAPEDARAIRLQAGGLGAH
jgi:hypothetical protein